VGQRAPAAALIEEDDPVHFRIEKAPILFRATGARTTVNEQHRHALGVTTLLDMQLMRWRDRELMGGKGLYRWIKSSH
jgi:hypothetical protein